MEPNNESFEAAQRRVTGQPPSFRDKLNSLVRRTNWSKVIIPSLFFGIMASVIARDFTEDLGLPQYAFIAVGLIAFLAVFVLSLSRESERRGGND